MTKGKIRKPGPWTRLDDGPAEIGDVLRLAFADMPPTPFDSEAVLADGKRRLVRRRLAVGAGVFLIVVTCVTARLVSRAG